MPEAVREAAEEAVSHVALAVAEAAPEGELDALVELLTVEDELRESTADGLKLGVALEESEGSAEDDTVKLLCAELLPARLIVPVALPELLSELRPLVVTVADEHLLAELEGVSESDKVAERDARSLVLVKALAELEGEEL